MIEWMFLSAVYSSLFQEFETTMSFDECKMLKELLHDIHIGSIHPYGIPHEILIRSGKKIECHISDHGYDMENPDCSVCQEYWRDVCSKHGQERINQCLECEQKQKSPMEIEPMTFHLPSDCFPRTEQTTTS
jgi:hypothetical protein